MKTMKKFFSMATIIALTFAVFSGFSQNNDDYTLITGSVKDAKTKSALFFAYVAIPNSHVGTVTNSEGNFALKISHRLNAEEVEFSHVGYLTKRVPIATLQEGDNEIMLEPTSISLEEVTIRPLDAEHLLSTALTKIPQNYTDAPNMLTGFYRETIKQRREYISISEAVLDIYKSSYKSLSGYDRVKIFKGRKSTNVKKADTLAIKLQGGPKVSLLLDLAKNPDIVFGEEYQRQYNFFIEDMVSIDNQLNYVISFKQKKEITTPLYQGKIYVDTKTLAITHARFSLNLDNIEEAANMFVIKKPKGVKFVPTATSYYVNYTEFEGKYYLNYIRNELSFKANWSRRIFSTSYSIVAEMAITDRDLSNITKFTYREGFKSTEALAETVAAFNDDDFWGEHNYIKPEESIEEAIKKYGKRLKRQKEQQ